jgi:hypothetical protein
MESSDVFIIIFFGKGLYVRWVGQLCMYPPRAYLCSDASLYVFLIP